VCGVGDALGELYNGLRVDANPATLIGLRPVLSHGRIDVEVSPPDGLFERAAEYVVDLAVVLPASGRQVCPCRGRPEQSSRHRCSRA